MDTARLGCISRQPTPKRRKETRRTVQRPELSYERCRIVWQPVSMSDGSICSRRMAIGIAIRRRMPCEPRSLPLTGAANLSPVNMNWFQWHLRIPKNIGGKPMPDPRPIGQPPEMLRKRIPASSMSPKEFGRATPSTDHKSPTKMENHHAIQHCLE